VAEFAVLRAADRVRVPESPGVETLELVGPMSPFGVNHSGLRRYADTTLTDGAAVDVTPEPDRGLMLYPVEGSLRVMRDGGDEVVLNASGSVHPEGPANLAVAWSSDKGRAIRLQALDRPARVLRIEFDRSGDDLVLGQPYLG
jgi:hypothetical protein